MLSWLDTMSLKNHSLPFIFQIKITTLLSLLLLPPFKPMREFILLISFCIFSISASVAATAAADILIVGKNLTGEETLVSAGGFFAFGFFSPINSSNRYAGIWYRNIPELTVVWVANRQSPIAAKSSGVLTLTSTGSLILTTNRSSTALWSSADAATATSATSSGSIVAQLLDSGNLVLRQSNRNVSGEFVWQSFDYPTDTLLHSMKLGKDLRSGLDRNLTCWASPSDPSPGKYTLAIDIRGVPQLIIKSGLSLVWRGGPWNGAGFVGVNSATTYDYITFSQFYLAGPDEIFYSFNTAHGHGALNQVVIGTDGIIRRKLWFNPPGAWSTLWSNQPDDCDHPSVSVCGAYAVCDPSKSGSLCSCLPGFEYKSDECVRTKALSCGKEGGTADGFSQVNKVKLPDTSTAMLEAGLDLERCRERCLMNCSCTAYARVNVTAGGSGCIMWAAELTDIKELVNGGQDIYVRLSLAGKKKKLWLFLIVSAAVASPIIAFSIFFMSLRRPRRSDNLLDVSKETSSDFFMFQFSQIREATESFSPANKVGKGGFGPVYKGKLLDGREVAVKRLSSSSRQGLKEFKNEILLIAKLQHRNLVRLLGCCIEGEEKMLVYEYLPNKSLDFFIFDPKQRAKLDWNRRFHIIDGIAQGLLYLHKHSRLTIIHRDLKASNILLDDDLNPKISDFGMARIFSANELEANITNKVVGTYGYISPEYALKGHFSRKSDVFSFGVIMLEIITGKRNSGFLHGTTCNLLAYAWKLWKDNNWAELVDDSLDGMYSLEELSRCVHVALLCVQERVADRPSTSKLIAMLNSDNAHLSYPNHPAFFLVENTANAPDSLDEVTITTIDGR